MSSTARRLYVRRDTFPIAGTFRISRGAKTEAEVVVAEVVESCKRGRGECVPYARYGESLDETVKTLESLAGAVADGLDRERLRTLLPPGAARNALDCALWDLEAKQAGKPAWRLAGLPDAPKKLTTCYTLSVDEPAAMAASAKARAADHPLLKMKLTGEGDLDRVRAVREAAPTTRLIVDANEAWTLEMLRRFAPVLADLGVELIEQPLPAGEDEALRGIDCPVALGADESCHGLDSLDRLKGIYRVMNIKLDKTGGLTEALLLKQAAQESGFDIMVGCMVATSLAMAPAVLLAQGARYVDLDGPLLLAEDRTPALHYDGGTLFPPAPELWG
ncbi:N-acetyl-D-Glu racemase DgcA [Azospirillum argentinense]|uniref:Dipeptide epimerase n=1 Tax=Azospirillum brasilense TaxID=192 RepID=A0A4D8PVE9_AZOBR|nr:N-acetyl-D-Glu racemase DgcA [Azospirillum argentinense]QCO00878.1 dipeptide epimerase [Azospirillum argentinense]